MNEPFEVGIFKFDAEGRMVQVTLHQCALNKSGLPCPLKFANGYPTIPEGGRLEMHAVTGNPQTREEVFGAYIP